LLAAVEPDEEMQLGRGADGAITLILTNDVPVSWGFRGLKLNSTIRFS
jgi:hypothetical protein